MTEFMEKLCQDLCIPRRIFEIGEGQTPGTEYLEWLEERDRKRRSQLQEHFTERFIKPLVEEAFTKRTLLTTGKRCKVWVVERPKAFKVEWK